MTKVDSIRCLSFDPTSGERMKKPKVNTDTAKLICGKQEVEIACLHDNGAVDIRINGELLYLEWDEYNRITGIHYGD